MNTENISTESFDHPPSPAELAQIYAQSEQNDPRSLLYERRLVRPRLPVGKLLLLALLMAAFYAVSAIVVFTLSHSPLAAVLTAMGALALTCVIFAKSILIWAVKIYQALAPERIRKRCRYEPSCSVYMILCVEKFGFWKGIRRGLTRWRGCKPPNGGYDWP